MVMLFKELKQNFPVFLLEKDEMKLLQGKVVSVSFPRMNTFPAGNTSMVVDVQIEVDGKTASYVIPEQSSITYSGNLVIATDKSLLSAEVEAMKSCAEQALAAVDKHKRVLDKADEILSQLNPAFKEKKETEKRFSSLENTMASMVKTIENQGKMLEQLLNRGV